MSAHTHIQQQLTYGKEQGWDQEHKLYEFNAGTTAGDWYSGTADELGVPASTMRTELQEAMRLFTLAIRIIK